MHDKTSTYFLSPKRSQNPSQTWTNTHIRQKNTSSSQGVSICLTTPNINSSCLPLPSSTRSNEVLLHRKKISMLEHKASIYESLLKKKNLINWDINTSKNKNNTIIDALSPQIWENLCPLVRITWKTEETSWFCGECMEVPTELADTDTYLWAAAPGSKVVTLRALSKWEQLWAEGGRKQNPPRPG